jgi:hypothetical protein
MFPSPLTPSRPIRFPISKITDATTGEVIAEKTGEFTVEMPFGQTRVFRTEAQPASQ